jgi:hypothetical protein
MHRRKSRAPRDPRSRETAPSASLFGLRLIDRQTTSIRTRNGRHRRVRFDAPGRNRLSGPAAPVRRVNRGSVVRPPRAGTLGNDPRFGSRVGRLGTLRSTGVPGISARPSWNGGLLQQYRLAGFLAVRHPPSRQGVVLDQRVLTHGVTARASTAREAQWAATAWAWRRTRIALRPRTFRTASSE